MKKGKVLSAVLAVCLVMAGCGETQTGGKGEPVTLTLWHYYNDDIKASFDTLVQEFNETVGAEKGIIVDAYSQGGVNELADALYASANGDIGANAMPDIFAAYSDSAYRLDKLGVVASLDAYYTEEELAAYRPEFLEDGRFSEDNTLKIIPVAKSTELLYINKTAFDKFAKETGASQTALQTWEGIAETAEKYYEWSGNAFFGIDSMSNFMIQGTKQLGADIFTVNNETVSFQLNEDTAGQIWDVFYVPFIKGYYAANGRFRSDDVKSGTIVAFIGSNSSASYFPDKIETGKDSGYEIESYVMGYPYFENGEKYCVHQGAGMVVTKTDEKREEACVEFLKWFTSPEQNQNFAASTSYMPVENEALTYDKTVEALGTTDEKDVRVQTAEALYQMLDEYKLYACKPFDKSMETRNLINNSLTDFINADMETLQARTDAGEDREEVCGELTGEENFMKWYQGLSDAMEETLNGN